MKNFIAVGNTLTITASGAVSAGDGVLVGSLFGVAAGDIANGAEGVINLTGVYDLPKAGSQAWAVGALVYWTGTACTTTASTNKLIGVAAAAVGSGAGETIGRVRLNGTGITA